MSKHDCCMAYGNLLLDFYVCCYPATSIYTWICHLCWPGLCCLPCQDSVTSGSIFAEPLCDNNCCFRNCFAFFQVCTMLQQDALCRVVVKLCPAILGASVENGEVAFNSGTHVATLSKMRIHLPRMSLVILLTPLQVVFTAGLSCQMQQHVCLYGCQAQALDCICASFRRSDFVVAHAQQHNTTRLST